MSVSCQISDPDLIEKFLFLKIGQTAFICQVTRLINKIDSCIRDSKKTQKSCLFKRSTRSYSREIERSE